MIHPISLAPNGDYGAGPLAPYDLWSAWTWEPLVLFSLLLPAWLYMRGVRRLWCSAGPGRGIARWQAAAFAGGWLALFVALVSPLDQLGTVLFAAHMVQHEMLMLIAAPLLATVAIAIRCTMGSPVLFRQRRAGRGGRPFEMIKFRTMRHPRPDEQGPESDHRRLTRLGRVLRATSLDELPSLVNVVRGEMSLVGPRPLPVRYLSRYSDHHARRHEVAPGMTGYAQVRGRNTLSWEEQLDLDVWYVDNRCLALDLKVLARTATTVVRREGVNHAEHVTRPEFPGSLATQETGPEPASGIQVGQQTTAARSEPAR
jgi:sugar transferase EpsL